MLIRYFNELMKQWNISSSLADELDQYIAAFALIIIAYLARVAAKYLVFDTIQRIVKHTKIEWDDILFDAKVIVHLKRMIPALVIYLLIPEIFEETKELLVIWLKKLCITYIVFQIVQFVYYFLDALYELNQKKEIYGDRPIKGFVQVIQITTYFIGIIIIISILINQSPINLLAGLGASAAVLILVFKDSILGFIAGLQLTANNMLKQGDWISMPKYGADGTVIEVTMHTVKVRNFDNTITMLPPYALVSDSFQNWRGMSESKGRRVKRAINIDIHSIKFCSLEMLERFKQIDLITDYINQKEEELRTFNENNNVSNRSLANGRRQTNIGIFRAYLEAYLRSLPGISNELTCMVRQLQPTELGIPMELYFFTNEKDWVIYEQIQSDVFDHVIAVVKEFDLEIFQSPSGKNFKVFGKGSNE